MSAPYPVADDDTQAAMQAHSNINAWGAVIDMLEGGACNHLNNTVKQSMIVRAKAETQRELKCMDKAVARINKRNRK